MGQFKDKRFKKNHKKDRGVSSFEAVKARNAAVTDDEEDPRKKNDDAESSSSGEEETPSNTNKGDSKVFVKEKGKTVHDLIEHQALNGGLDNDEALMAEGPTRKQREEIEKERKKRAYEKLHKEGKTDEAKADLARLAEIKARRAAAAQEREDKKKEEEAKVAALRGTSSSAFVENLGGEKSRKLPGGAGSKKRADECGDMYSAYKGEGIADAMAQDAKDALHGSIEACRAAEDDFM
ncbi:unnamed protein product [Amoebophrya sp. A25]|nr:unnamed protein product [Amoebophrya sp. A25]|eukprot:GSA25T00025278001.1